MSETKNKIAILDYGMGNLHSVAKALEHVDSAAVIRITSNPEIIAKADRVVFPGVGAMRDCMKAIKRSGLDNAIRAVLRDGKPFLGICAGMQALMKFSAENGGTPCIGMLAGEVKYFGRIKGARGEVLKVPHMGWNKVEQVTAHPLWRGIPDNSRFYFVHSYYVEPGRPDLIAGLTEYGIDFTSVVAKKNLFACQFHPEKSHDAGLQLLKNFCAWDGEAYECL